MHGHDCQIVDVDAKGTTDLPQRSAVDYPGRGNIVFVLILQMQSHANPRLMTTNDSIGPKHNMLTMPGAIYVDMLMVSTSPF